jgi:hypothetical protein
MALDRNQRRGGTAGHLSGKDWAARRPTRKVPAVGALLGRCRCGIVTDAPAIFALRDDPIAPAHYVP